MAVADYFVYTMCKSKTIFFVCPIFAQHRIQYMVQKCSTSVNEDKASIRDFSVKLKKIKKSFSQRILQIFYVRVFKISRSK